MAAARFATRLLRWWEQHGRHDLPWQSQRTPYRVWLSEVMLQQTQVATVIPYFQRFVERFPNLASLACAEQDDVLALWSGLGYYSRGRNLHRCARLCMQEYAGELPDDPEILATLPGIGPSTANAIVSQAHDRVLPILDGNVKRVMARHAAIEGWPGQTQVVQQLWQAASERLPRQRGADYTQAIMDLGATLCRSRTPDCAQCPVAADCLGRQRDLIAELPGRKPRRSLPLREATFLLLSNPADEIYLLRRPNQGIWSGLWCLPEFAGHADMLAWLEQQQLKQPPVSQWARFNHSFTHYKLSATVYRCQPKARSLQRFDQRVADVAGEWNSTKAALSRGLPQPIRRLLEQYADNDLLAGGQT